MKNLIWIFLFITATTFAQNPKEAFELVKDGVKLHDSGQYQEALKLYEEALKIDKDNFYALSETSITLSALQNYKEAIKYCELVIKKYPKKDLSATYLNLANSYDHIGLSQKALQTYDKALKKYDDYYQLHFNKGVTLINMNKTAEAFESFKKSAALNLNHANSLNAIIILNQKKKIPTILAASRYLILDNKSPRAKNHLELLKDKIQFDVKRTGTNEISINLSQDLLLMDKKSPDNFSTTEMILAMKIATVLVDTTLTENEMQQFITVYTILCQSLKESIEKNKGYYWETFAPFFVEMYDNDYVEVFANLIHAPTEDPTVLEYLATNEDKVHEFLSWAHNWKKRN